MRRSEFFVQFGEHLTRLAGEQPPRHLCVIDRLSPGNIAPAGEQQGGAAVGPHRHPQRGGYDFE